MKIIDFFQSYYIFVISKTASTMKKIKNSLVCLFFFVLLFLVFNLNLSGQISSEAEDLYNELVLNAGQVKDDSATVEKYYKYARLCAEKDGAWNTGKEPYICYEGFKMSERIGYQKGINEFIDVLKVCFQQKEGFPLIIKHPYDDKITRNNLRLVHQKRKELHGGTLDWYKPGIENFLRLKMYNEAGILSFWNALYFYDVENYLIAGKLLDESTKYLKIAGNTSRQLKVDTYKGCMYYFMKEYLKADEIFSRVINNSKHAQDTEALVYSLYNRGEVYFSMKEYQKAYVDFITATEIDTVNNITGNPIPGLVKMARAALALHRYELCHDLLDKALAGAKKLNDKSTISEIYFLRYEVYRKIGLSENALLNLEKFQTLHDSLFTAEMADFIKVRENFWINKLGRQITFQAHIDHERDAYYVQLQKNKLILWGIIFITLILGIGGILLYRSNQNNKKANRYLKELDTTRNLFFSIIAHDLRGPLTATELYLKPLLSNTDKYTKAELITSLEEIGKQTVNQKLLLDNLLYWSGMQKGSMKCELSDVNLKQVAQNNISLYLSAAAQKNIRFFIEISETIYVRADENMLSLIFRNLIDNSVKYGGNDIIIKLEAHAEGHTIQINHCDTGNGFGKNTIEHFNSDSYNMDDNKGQNLGLSLVRLFISRQGGRVEISNMNPGACVRFTLPSIMQKH